MPQSLKPSHSNELLSANLLFKGKKENQGGRTGALADPPSVCLFIHDESSRRFQFIKSEFIELGNVIYLVISSYFPS